MPRSTVRESSQEAKNVANTPSATAAVSKTAVTTKLFPAKNIAINNSSKGNRPLQGTRLLVRMATSRSRGESMMRQPITPTALQPKPIAMVSACLPHARQRRSAPSKLKATRGR